jgi:ferredoxin
LGEAGGVGGMHVWIDQDLCTGDGLCTDHCPEVFVLLEDGISYVRDASARTLNSDPGGRSSMVSVLAKHEGHVIDAALDCPGECIFVEQTVVDVRPDADDGAAATRPESADLDR